MRHLVTLAVVGVVVLGTHVCLGEGKRCFNRPCARMLARALRAANRCFKTSGSCIDDGPVTCWKNGAYLERSVVEYPMTRTFSRTGKLCLTTTFGSSSAGFDITYVRGVRTWRWRRAANGIEVICPSGRSELYTDEHLSTPPCTSHVGGEAPSECAIGTCP